MALAGVEKPVIKRARSALLLIVGAGAALRGSTPPPVEKIAVRGVVEDCGGKAVGGALAAVVPILGDTATHAAALVRTAPDGTFEARVPKGRYALTATAADRNAAYHDVEEVADATRSPFVFKVGCPCYFVATGRVEIYGGDRP